MTDITEFPPAPIDLTNIDAALDYGWMPGTVPAAEWAAVQLRKAYDELNVVRTDVEGYVTMVKQWAATQFHVGRGGYLVKRVKFFEDALKRYALWQRDEGGVDYKGDPIAATTRLPSATISTRVGKKEHYEWRVLDDAALLAWCESNRPEAITRFVDIDKLGELRVKDDDEQTMVVDENGEIVPGIDHVLVEARPTTATISLVDNADAF